MRAVIEGCTLGFCKLVVDRRTYRILGCPVVGERAVEIVQLAAIVIAAAMPGQVPEVVRAELRLRFVSSLPR